MDLRHPKNICLVLILLTGHAIFFNRCDHGLAPPAEVPPSASGISGIIRYTNWPDSATIKNLKIVVFRNFPPGNILEEVITGNAVFSPPDLDTSLPIWVDSTAYTIKLYPGEYGYVVVAQQFGELYDWRAVGQYDTTPEDSLPTPVTVPENTFLEHIDIKVDFDNLPIQPL